MAGRKGKKRKQGCSPLSEWTYLPQILLEESMDDDPHQAIKASIDKIHKTMVVVDLRRGSVVYTSTQGIFYEDMREGRKEESIQPQGFML